MEELFRLLADATRLRILALLKDGARCVCEIESGLSLSQTNASRHLNLMKRAGLLISQKRAQWIYYSVSSDFIRENGELWNYLCAKFAESEPYQSDALRAEKEQQENACGEN